MGYPFVFWVFSKEVADLWRFDLVGAFSVIFSAPGGETMRWMCCFKDATMVLCQEWWGLEFARRRGRKSSMHFCLAVTLWNSRVYDNEFTIKACEYGNAFDVVDIGEGLSLCTRVQLCYLFVYFFGIVLYFICVFSGRLALCSLFEMK